nr:uncharacterized protein LOC123281537 isoform X1 [Equus asinus]
MERNKDSGEKMVRTYQQATNFESSPTAKLVRKRGNTFQYSQDGGGKSVQVFRFLLGFRSWVFRSFSQAPKPPLSRPHIHHDNGGQGRNNHPDSEKNAPPQNTLACEGKPAKAKKFRKVWATKMVICGPKPENLRGWESFMPRRAVCQEASPAPGIHLSWAVSLTILPFRRGASRCSQESIVDRDDFCSYRTHELPIYTLSELNFHVVRQQRRKTHNLSLCPLLPSELGS